VGLTYTDLPERRAGRRYVLLLDDGRLVLEGRCASTGSGVSRPRVVVGGTLSNNKGINRQGGGLSAPAITEPRTARTSAWRPSWRSTYLAVSFPSARRRTSTSRETLLREAGGDASICAKIERAEAHGGDRRDHLRPRT
jgi:pyruvate kinase